MKTFNVYHHPTLGIKSIKSGFSFPALFFTIIWAFYKKLFGIGSLFLGILVVLAIISMETINNEDVETFSWLFTYGMWIYFGIKGNMWLSNDLIKRGYELVDAVQATSQGAAIAQIAKKSDINAVDAA